MNHMIVSLVKPAPKAAEVAHVRTCTGACPFFAAHYDAGRKVPGTGLCGYHESAMATQVGTACGWNLDRRLKERPSSGD